MRKCAFLIILLYIGQSLFSQKNTLDSLFQQAQSYKHIVALLNFSHWEKAVIQHIPSIFPLKYRRISDFYISSKFGYRRHPIKGVLRFHNGIDIPAAYGTQVYATASGRVEQISFQKAGLGLYVSVRHPYGFTTLYGHLSEVNVYKGQKIKQGSILGFVGITGETTGPHLHYIIRKNHYNLDPYPFCFLMIEKFKKEKTKSALLYK